MHDSEESYYTNEIKSLQAEGVAIPTRDCFVADTPRKDVTKFLPPHGGRELEGGGIEYTLHSMHR